jgi:hypothetical protein
MSKYVDGINEERFDLFLKDLRSGEFEQGRNSLESNGKFCCLGVACVRPTAKGIVQRQHAGGSSYMYGNDRVTSTALPIEVADYLGIPERNRTNNELATDVILFKQDRRHCPCGAECDIDSPTTAIRMNDSLGKSFAEIADAFELEFRKGA